MKTESITLGGGCFWCTEAVFLRLKGVQYVTPGYSGGSTDNPTYKEVCSGNTGHAEVIKIEFDPDQTPLELILKIFFATHDPTTLNRQGNDVGTQYRSVIFYNNPEQRLIAEQIIQHAQQDFEQKIVTTIEPANHFYPAEDYHQNYFENNPQNLYCQAVIPPKLNKLFQKYQKFLKTSLH